MAAPQRLHPRGDRRSVGPLRPRQRVGAADAGVAQVRATLAEQGVEVIQVDLPYGTMHLMGVLRIVDRDLAIA